MPGEVVPPIPPVDVSPTPLDAPGIPAGFSDAAGSIRLHRSTGNRMSDWEGLSPPYATIVVDPPWKVKQTNGWGVSGNGPLPYSTLSLEGITRLPVADLAADYCHLYLWTVNRYLRDAFDVVAAWGFSPSTVLTWCKAPRGIGPGREFTITTEFVLLCKRGNGHSWGGSLPTRINSTWFDWPRGAHSVKPPAFFDLVEQVSPGPRVELFARQPRLGWDHWGYGYESAVNA